VESATARDFHSVHLGKRILRAETAAVTVLSLVQFLWGDLT
jgi:16S rRNA (uracil1498-N3)-methyltransferase